MPETTEVARRRSERRRPSATPLVIGVAAVIAAAATLVMLFVRSPEPEPAALPQVSFKTTLETHPQGPAPASAEDRTEARNAVRDLLNRWYQAGFVDPAAWQDGTFPAVKALLDQEAAARFDADVETLTVGSARSALRRVEPEKAEAQVTLYADAEGAVRFAVAEVSFEAVATQTDEEAPDLRIVQTATYHLRPGDQGWLVFAYDAAQRQDPIEPEATP